MLLENIPPEILLESLLPLLPIHDLLALGATSRFFQSLTSDNHFWRLFTLHTFRLPPQPLRRSGWKDLFRRLSSARVFTWGANRDGRLGHSYPQSVTSGVKVPTEVRDLRREVVVDIVCGGWSMWALTSSGKVYGWGKVQGDIFVGNIRHSPCHIALPHPVDRIYAGRRRLWALSQSPSFAQTIFTIDSDFDKFHRCRIIGLGPDVFTSPTSLPSPDHKVLHFAAGWKAAAAVFSGGMGLRVWMPDDAPDRDFSGSEDKFYPSRMVTRMEEYEYDDMKDGEQVDLTIIGLTVGEGFLIYLTRKGWVYRVNFAEHDFGLDNAEIGESAMPLTSVRLEKFVAPEGSKPLSHISGAFRHFGVFSESGDVLIGDQSSSQDSEPLILPEIQQSGVIQLSWGDYHALALLEDGRVLSWGKELQLNGCLGFGYKDVNDALDMGLHYEFGQIICRSPRQIRKFGRWNVTGEGEGGSFRDENGLLAFGIAAAGWHCGALVAGEWGDRRAEELREEEEKRLNDEERERDANEFRRRLDELNMTHPGGPLGGRRIPRPGMPRTNNAGG